MNARNITILPLGNTGSLRRTLERLGATVAVTDDPGVGLACERLVVPGVGRFGSYMRALRDRGLDRAILDRIEQRKPTLCVCVGMQALAQGSDEDPDEPGLAVLPERCVPVTAARSTAYGWTRVAGLSLDDDYAYFVHSYAMPGTAEVPGAWLHAAHTKGRPFAAGYAHGPLVACQFHPETSGALGLRILDDWMRGREISVDSDAPVDDRGTRRRVIACLDVNRGRLVKGEQFVNLVDFGDPAAAAHRYEAQGADELVVLDISATPDDADTLLGMVAKVSKALTIPLTVGGGVRSFDDAARLFEIGADKVSVNTAAVNNPDLITQIASKFGAQSCVVAIDARWRADTPVVCVRGGREPTDLAADEWAAQAQRRGCGEILLTSMDRDGTGEGYDTRLIERVAGSINASVVASGGYGAEGHAAQAIAAGADAVLLAGALHRGETTISNVKQALADAGQEVRPCSSPA